MASTPLFTEELNKEIERRAGRELSDEKIQEFLLHFPDLEQELNDLCSLFHHKIYVERPRVIYWAFLNEMHFGAFAYETPIDHTGEPFDFLAINIGTIRILFDNFSHILSSRDSFEECGSVSNEEQSPPNKWLSHIDEPPNFASIPHCRVRCEFSKILTRLATFFLAFHELTHLRHGHNQYLIQSKASGAYSALEEQSLELLADFEALQYLMKMAFSLLQGANNSDLEGTRDWIDAHHFAFRDITQLAITVTYALYSLFRFIHPGDWIDNIDPSKKHPPILFRARYLIIKIVDFIKDSHPTCDVNSIIDTVYFAIHKVETDIARMVDRDKLTKPIGDALKSERAEAHLKLLVAKAEEIKSKLSPYSK